MNWLYYIMHEWEEKYTTWEEAFVLPDSPDYKGDALWVTVDSLGSTGAHPHIMQEIEQELNEKDVWFRTNESGLEDCDSDVIINVSKFSREQFIDALRGFLLAQGLSVGELVEGKLTDFAGRHPHADLLMELTKESPEEE